MRPYRKRHETIKDTGMRPYRKRHETIKDTGMRPYRYRYKWNDKHNSKQNIKLVPG